MLQAKAALHKLLLIKLIDAISNSNTHITGLRLSTIAWLTFHKMTANRMLHLCCSVISLKAQRYLAMS